ncbi:beta-propeller domain-containing protein [Candidatus Dojkabacteria bacterium]|nr:beta-propeller domain-containing protein [Candidatus Dojkabacteria bacterium]
MPKQKRKFFIIVGSFTLIFLLTAGSLVAGIYFLAREAEDDPPFTADSTISETIEAFSVDEFNNYAQELVDTQGDEYKNSSYGLGALEETESSDAAAAPESQGLGDAGDESITNNQEAGVDEGDIVKAFGDYLIILRRGKLFSVDIENMKAISSVNAYPDGFEADGWYDEILISNGRIVLIGYNYSESATEIGLFDIDSAGEITHIDTYFVDSNDYYSSRNYASRLVDGELILYMPYYLAFDRDSYEPTFPKLHKWDKSEKAVNDGEAILDKTNVYKPVQETLYPTLHTVMRCDIESFDCSAKGILGPYSRNFYVSPEAIYLWVSNSYGYYYLEDSASSADSEDELNDAFIYRFDLQDDNITGLATKGTPIDQFSFKEADGYLNVVTRSNAWGDEMWFPEFSSGDLSLLRIKISKFDSDPIVAKQRYYHPLDESTGSNMQNRFVGDYLLYGSSNYWYSYYENESASNDQELYVYNYKQNSDVDVIELDHNVERIDALGDNAIAIGSDDNNLFFTSINLQKARDIDTYRLKDVSQAESRSHGFFFKKNSNDDGGILGLPIFDTGMTIRPLADSGVEVIYLELDYDLNFERVGIVSSRAANQVDDNCTVSCVDWYGNSRPIFYGDNIYTLIGYELVKGEVQDGEIVELSRVGFGG